MISSFRVSNYRQFEDLHVEGLRRLNLIVGENAVGKSALLEAIWLHVNDGTVDVLKDILAMRGETCKPGLYAENPKDLARSPLSTFTPWPPEQGSTDFEWRTWAGNESEPRESRYVVSLNEYARGQAAYSTSSDDLNEIFYGKKISESKDPVLYWHLFPINIADFEKASRLQSKRGNNVFVPAIGLDADFVRDFWEKVALTEVEDEVDRAVQLLEPAIQRISLGSGNPVVKLKNAPAPIPMSRLGEGMTRLFALALAVVNAKGGVLLIDEIETGMHRATLDRMWRFLFTLAERFNVQLFATTHSWDCISSFAAAAKAAGEDVAALIRLERKDGKVVAVTYDEQTLATATEQGIEVR